MREILFRGKRKKGDKRWVEGNLTQGYAGYVGIMVRCCAGTSFEVDPKTVGQYTGITINGTKIFEGDILSTPKWKGVVTWGDGYGGYCVQHGINRPAIDIVMNEFDVEVIGNIYDNPELMGDDAHG